MKLELISCQHTKDVEAPAMELQQDRSRRRGKTQGAGESEKENSFSLKADMTVLTVSILNLVEMKYLNVKEKSRMGAKPLEDFGTTHVWP